MGRLMRYLPPSFVITTPKEVSPTVFQEWVDAFRHDGTSSAYKTLYLANGAYPQMVIVPPGLPRTFDEYRQSLYGDIRRDWLPTLSYGFLTALIVFILIVAMVLVSWVL